MASSEAKLSFQPAVLEFDELIAGQRSELSLRLVNEGRRAAAVTFEGPEGPFEVNAFPAEAPPGEEKLTVVFRPFEQGLFVGALTVRYDDKSAAVELRGTALPVPACPEDSACTRWHFDLEQGRCEEAELPNGSACLAQSACLLNASCQEGRCVGTSLGCDDGNACTIDVCNAVTGCEHLPRPPCPGDGKCQVGLCNPQTGCELAPAEDGTICGSTQTCDVADVCIAGQCEKRDPPDGFVCAPASPCQGEGRCVGSSCERPAATTLGTSFTFDAKTAVDAPELHDFVLEPTGSVSLLGWFAVPRFRVNTAGAKDGVTRARRCIIWNSRIACADYPYVSSGRVSGIDPASGATLWTVDLPAARKDFAAMAGDGHIFLARLVALGSDRLAALYEAYPARSPPPTNCRMYFLVVVNAAGQIVSAQRVTDPMLDVCNHPHPFGVVADAVGNLTIAFSGSTGSAPLQPASPTLMMSFTRDGVFRWKRVENFVGGELAAARGLIYPEKGNFAYLSSTGAPYAPASMSTGVFGRVLVSSDRVIPAPVRGASVFSGFEAGTNQPRWNYSPPVGQVFSSEQTRLAWWRPSPRDAPETVALVFMHREGKPNVVAVNARTGVERWACALGHRWTTEPQLVEVANGSMALMEGSNTCGTCDPPFAQSQAAFHLFPMAGLEVPQEPWVGTFGGAGHDHREDGPTPMGQ